MKLPIFRCLYYEIWTYFYVFDLKRKAFAGFFPWEISKFYFKQNKQLLCYERNALYSYLKISKHLSGVIPQNSSAWSLQKAPQPSKEKHIQSQRQKQKEKKKQQHLNCFSQCYSSVFMITLEYIFQVCDGVCF